MKHNCQLPDLMPGDVLAYEPMSWREDIGGALFDRIAALKTWTWLCHVEIYAGHNETFAARSTGVNVYKFRKSNLAYVLRFDGTIDWCRGERWFFREAIGQKYDYKGLLCFSLAVKAGDPNKMFCSEFMTRFYLKMGNPLFGETWDCDKVPPSFVLVTPKLKVIWKKN